MLFMMIPRMDALYEDVDKLDYLFPFKNVKKGSNIILYGMGTYGQFLYRFIKERDFCNILASSFAKVSDAIYKELSLKYPSEKIQLMVDAWMEKIARLLQNGVMESMNVFMHSNQKVLIKRK